MRFKIKCHLKILACLLASIVIYNECLVYYIKSLKWPKVECSPDSYDCVKILLVADSQILGERRSDGFLNYVFSLDSNRYLAKTYSRVVSHFKPDTVLFLGDMTYDGSINLESEFYDDVKTLAAIFEPPYPMTYVWIPGDNDIGGENEPIYANKIRQYNAAFKQPDVVEVKNVVVYKANNLLQKIPKSRPSQQGTNVTRIVISHIPLLLSPGRFTENVFVRLQPSVIFSGHKHSAFHLETTTEAMFVSKVVAMTPQDEEDIINIEFKQNTYHEFVVPTCSYRMGVLNIGYSVAVIEKSKYMTYAILWSPRRFEQLLLYVVLIFAAGLYFFVIIVCKMTTSTCWTNVQCSKV